MSPPEEKASAVSMAGFRPSFNFNDQYPDEMHRFSPSSFYNFELTRILGTAPASGCDIAEFIEAAGTIRKHDPESWYREWNGKAQKAAQQGHAAAERQHRQFARKAFLRAASYYRAAAYMIVDHSDPRILRSAELSIENFECAIAFFDEVEVIKLEIPFEGTRLPGYLLLPPSSRRLSSGTPVLLNCGGADSTKEELYFMFGPPALQVGYAVLLFDGPGQGIILKRDHIPIRADFEVVTSSVLDHIWTLASTHPDWNLDLTRVAIAGTSLGGYFALRSASTADSRIAACVAIDPVYSLWDVAATRMPTWYLHLWTSGWLPEWFFNWSCQSHMRMDFATEWEFRLCMWIMGLATPGDVLRRFQQFSLRTENGDELLERVRCPVMLTGAPDTIYSDPSASTMRIMTGLVAVDEAKKEMWIPESPGEGSLTGKVGAWDRLGERVFAFLDLQMNVKR